MRTASNIRREIEQRRSEINQLEQELADLREPAEPEANPSVIFFEKTFGKSTTYGYTAVKVVKRNGAPAEWWITGNRPGRNPNPKTWEQMLAFLAQGEKEMPEIYLATQLVPLGSVDFEK